MALKDYFRSLEKPPHRKIFCTTDLLIYKLFINTQKDPSPKDTKLYQNKGYATEALIKNHMSTL